MGAHETVTSIDGIWRQHRPYLVGVAFRMLGTIHDAEDAVQEAFTRLLRADLDTIDDVRGWLVVVVSRICLDQLRSARTRHESGSAAPEDERPVLGPPTVDPADRVTLDASVSMALLVVMERLSPAERAVFVLHDIFQFTFDAVGAIVGRSPAACRQIARRARQRIEEATGPARFAAGPAEHDDVAMRFIAACSGGDLAGLMAVLDPDVIGDVDLGPAGPPRRPLRGAPTVSRGILGRFGPHAGVTLVSQAVNGRPGILAFRGERLEAVMVLTVVDGRIRDIHAIADPEKMSFVMAPLSAPSPPRT